MTPEQEGRLPELLREIVVLDRRIAALRADIVSASVALDMPVRAVWAELRERRNTLRREAKNQYGRVPLRGDTGPGRPTSARA